LAVRALDGLPGGPFQGAAAAVLVLGDGLGARVAVGICADGPGGDLEELALLAGASGELALPPVGALETGGAGLVGSGVDAGPVR